MNALILFGCSKKLTRSHIKVDRFRKGNDEYFVRCVRVVNMDCVKALDYAKNVIMEGETLLNTVDL